jgi:hypothetical protein
MYLGISAVVYYATILSLVIGVVLAQFATYMVVQKGWKDFTANAVSGAVAVAVLLFFAEVQIKDGADVFHFGYSSFGTAAYMGIIESLSFGIMRTINDILFYGWPAPLFRRPLDLPYLPTHRTIEQIKAAVDKVSRDKSKL